ncbi:hypothetical protein DU508_05410 [Pedobacter chinensis]|uniref:Uncharacterized protein n=1 Tax=Pedobacter chinensis TaxID=2282421 RepID=A0A369PWN7_9SPHI|nr:IS66 family insertion sequence element accessory protein TnpB [Pedobacter chinensis]RDC56650.1 hypothetical protein DU508_05410 [Pedobacter chinensis]
MNRKIKLLNDEFFQTVVGDRGLRMYRKPVDGRLGMTGLGKLVEKETGAEPKLNEAYAFKVKNRNIIKILTRDEISTNLLELHEGNADEMTDLAAELGLML